MINISTLQTKQYNLAVFLTGLITISLVITLNSFIDPYRMLQLNISEKLFTYKPAINNRVRLAKAHDVRRIKPRTIILGTSRTHLGIRPSHNVWSDDLRPVYNLAFDGATTREMFYYLQHAQAVQPLRQVLLGLDTYHLTNAPATVQADFDKQLLLSSPSVWSKAGVLLADIKLLMSISTLLESINTLRAQDQHKTQWFAPDGQRLGEVFFHQPWEQFQLLGPRDYFEEIDRSEVAYKLAYRIPSSSKNKSERYAKITAAQVDKASSLDYIQQIIHYCRVNDIELFIYITPTHSHQNEISAATGEWETIENGKRALVNLLTEDARQHAKHKPFELYDFSVYSSINNEKLPALTSQKELKYYWESSHFKEQTGDLVLNRIFNQGIVPDDFGLRLNSHSIEKALAEIRHKQQIYRSRHPEDVTLIEMYISDYKNKHNIPDWEN